MNTLLVAVTLGVCLEAGSRVILRINPLRRRATSFDDASYRLQWVRLRPAHAEWTGPFAAYDAVRGWLLKPNIRNMHVEDGTVLNTNSKGLRGTVEYPYERVPGKQRILVLGDSYSFGSEVTDNDTYSQRLEMSLPDTEVLNLGVQGYGHDQMLLYLDREGARYHPDVVIVGFIYFDIYRNILNFFAYAKPEYELRGNELVLTHEPVPTPAEVLEHERYRPKTLDLLNMLDDKLRWASGANERTARALTSALLGKIAADARGMGAKPVFLYMPAQEEIQSIPDGYHILTTHSPPIPSREAFLRSVCEQNQVPCLFLGDLFRKEAAAGVDLNPKSHWNAAAHTLAAQQLQQFLLQNGLIHGADAAPTKAR